MQSCRIWEEGGKERKKNTIEEERKGLQEERKEASLLPLVRYEVRCEHSLANPELFRAAGGAAAAAAAGSLDDDDVDDAKAADDDVSSQGLLEGVAVAGLVGIVRQIGNLVEYVPPSLPSSSIGSSHQILFV